MNVLVIGGTKFVGRAVTEELLRRGHSVTHFNRGQSNPGAFPEVPTVHGDRFSDLGRLGDAHWDAVVDTCGYVPRAVTAAADALQGRVTTYLFVSTISVYAESSEPAAETAALALPVLDTEEINGETYGGLKVSCEQVVRERWGDRATIVRPGLIIGPHDHTKRFTSWPVRFAAGGKVLVPNAKGRRLTGLDVRDFAAFMADRLEQGWHGTVNVDRPWFEWDDVVAAGKENWQFEPVWVDEAFLHGQGVAPWTDLPMWLPETLAVGDTSLAESLGLPCTKLAKTMADTLEFARSVGHGRDEVACLTSDKEKEVVSSWLSR